VDEATGKAVPGIGPVDGKVVDFAAITGGLTLEQWVEKNREGFHPLNRWVLSQLQDAITKTEAGLEEFRVNDATAAMYQFTWGSFCDWYIEYSKALLAVDGPGADNPKLVNETYVCLLYVLETQLRLAHPFIPFITEEIWAHLPARPGVKKGDALMVAAYPKARQAWIDKGADHDVGVWTDIIARIRTFRGENNIAPKARPEMTFEMLPSATAETQAVRAGASYIKAVGQLAGFNAEIGRLKNDPATGEIVTNTAKLYIPLHGLVDFGAEKKRLEKELAAAKKDIEFFEKKLGNEAFVAKAPPELIVEQKAKLAAAQQKLAEVVKSQERIAKL
jgi:valyl-tRNA synthetase